MFCTVYKITNIINGKIYIGAHRTNNLDDGYMGSGVHIRRAINKYGIVNFTKEYIAVFDNSDDMFNMESTLVNSSFIARNDTYNVVEGGGCSFDSINANSYLQRQKAIKSNAVQKELRKSPEWRKKKHDNQSRAFKEQYRLGERTTPTAFIYSFKGKQHAFETKQKIGKANSLHQSGRGNSQYGTCWVYCPYTHENKKVPTADLNIWEDRGWVKGRKLH